MGALVHHKRAFDPERDLTEAVPWGISTVLEDLEFWKDKDPKGEIAVCVSDTGYDIDHPDLPNEVGIDVDGRDNYKESWKEDEFDHGAHCAGTVAAKGNNDIGVVGVIPNSFGGKFKLIITKSLNKKGYGSVSQGIRA